MGGYWADQAGLYWGEVTNSRVLGPPAGLSREGGELKWVVQCAPMCAEWGSILLFKEHGPLEFSRTRPKKYSVATSLWKRRSTVPDGDESEYVNMGTTSSIEEQLESVDWDGTFKRLTVHAMRRLRRMGLSRICNEAEDFAQEALTRFLDPTYGDWDGEKPLLEHLGSIVNGLIANRLRVKSTSAEVLRERSSPKDKPLFATLPDSPELVTIESHEAEQVLTKTLERAAEDKVVEDLLMLACDGVCDAKSQANRLGIPVSRVYEGRRRLTKHILEVRELQDREVENA